MNEGQGDKIIELLEDILTELRDIRSEFQEFTGYNTTKMSDAVSEITDRITGGIGVSAVKTLPTSFARCTLSRVRSTSSRDCHAAK